MALRKDRIILFAALFVIACIFFFAFGWLNDDGGSSLTEDEDAYHLQRRFAPPFNIAEDKNSLPKTWPKEGLDFVFFWTRPLDEDRLADYEATFRATMRDRKVITEEMSSDFAQWEYYFARGLEHFAPWFRKLVVVVPDNVLSRPFNQSDNRILYVKHSDIMDEELLPVFDWRTLLLNFVSSKFIDGRVTKKFVYADDLSFLISYLSPTSLTTLEGEAILPLINTSISTPLQQLESKILTNTDKMLRDAINSFSARLGFTKEETSKTLDSLSSKMPLFETRGLQLLDRQVFKDVFAICNDPLGQAKLHRLRHEDSIDPVYLHHIFIYYMRELYKIPSAAKMYVTKSDQDNNGILTRDELIALAESLYYENSAAGKWVASLFDRKEFTGKKDIDLKALLGNEEIVAQMALTAVRPQFRYITAESFTVALELRRSIKLRLGKVIPTLQEGTIAAIRLGPRILGHEGGNTKEAMENLLWNILRSKFTSLETLYKPPPALGMKIGLAYFCLFFFGAWGFSKWMLRTAKKSMD